MKNKKYLALLLSILFVFSISSPVFADQGAPKDEVNKNSSKSLGLLTYQDATKEIYDLTDKESLEKVIDSENIKVPEGYQLTSVKTTVLYTDPIVNNNVDGANEQLSGNDIVVPMSTYWVKWIENVRTVGERYYADQPLYSDVLDGPLPKGYTYSLSDTINAGFTTKFGFSASDISAEVGFNASTGHAISRSFTTDSITSNQRINVKIFTNYLYREFDELRYLQSGGIKGPTERAAGSAWRPVGYYIQQFIFSK